MEGTWAKHEYNYDRLEKRIARNKKEIGGNIENGVTALPFKLYAHLSKQLAMKDKTGPFSWCYNTLLWNLMCRSDVKSYVNLNHMKVKDDHLIIYFAQSIRLASVNL